jgi:hypothetical protein
MSGSVATRLDQKLKGRSGAVNILDVVFGVPHLAASPSWPMDPETRFRTLLVRWRRENEFVSSIDEMAEGRAWQAIVAMGRDAVPFLLREIETDQPAFWGLALRLILKDGPTIEAADAADHTGRVREAWRNWARERGLST